MVSIVGTVGIPAKYGGFETLAEHLTAHLASAYQISVYCSSAAYAEKQTVHNGAKLVYLPLDANGVQSIPYDILAMIHAARRADVMLILGVSGCLFLPVLRIFFKGRVIVNIDGLEWRRDKWGAAAKRFLKLSEKMAVRYADAVVADNAAIADYVRAEYGREAATIAYGADHVSSRGLTPEALQGFPFLLQPYAFKVCRIEPENNIQMILEAFSQMPERTLVVVGNWQGSAYGQRLREQFEACPNLFMLDPIYDQSLLDQLRSNCVLYVHGHSAGGTNPSLAEAMYLGLPIVAYDVNYNRETTNQQAAYFKDSDDLKRMVGTLTQARLNEVGSRMAEYAKKHYTWAAISEAYAKLFEEESV